MKLGPKTNFQNANTATSKKRLTMTSCRQIVKSLSFFGYMANLEQLTVTLYLTKIEKKTKKSLTQLSYYCFE